MSWSAAWSAACRGRPLRSRRRVPLALVALAGLPLAACGPSVGTVTAVVERSAVPGSGTTYSGTATGGSSRVVLQRLVAGAWLDTRSTTTAPNGSWSISVPYLAGTGLQRVQSRSAAGAVQTTSGTSRVGAGVMAVSPAISSWLAGRAGTASVAVYDAATGATSVYGAGRRYRFASTRKLDILGAVLRRAALAGRPLTATEAAHAVPMIEQSSNNDATWLWNSVGGTSGAVAWERRAGLSQTTQDPGGFWGLGQTSATDELALLEALLSPNPLLRAADRTYARSLLGHVSATQSWGVSAGAPAGSVVLLKNGWLPYDGVWYVNSVGRVANGGHEYDIAVLTTTPGTGSSSFTYGIATIEGVSRLLWGASPAPARAALRAAPSRVDG